MNETIDLVLFTYSVIEFRLHLHYLHQLGAVHILYAQEGGVALIKYQDGTRKREGRVLKTGIFVI